MSIQQILSLLGRQQNNLPGILTEIMQNNGVNMNEIFSPNVDVVENDSFVKVYLNIPGVDSNSLDVDFFNNTINIKGDRIKPYDSDSDMTLIKNEIIYGTFERKITLPISVTKRESVTVNTQNGVLIIIIDKVCEEHNRFSIRVSNADNPSGIQTSGNHSTVIINSNNTSESFDSEESETHI